MNRIQRTVAARRGFTLIELLVVILILGILAALIVPRVIGRQGDAKIAAAKSDISSLESALSQFRLDADRYPTTEEGLDALRQAPSGLDTSKLHEPYLDHPLPQDPWQHPYVYKCPGSGGSDSYVLESYGKDGTEGGTGEDADIVVEVGGGSN